MIAFMIWIWLSTYAVSGDTGSLEIGVEWPPATEERGR